VTNNGSAFGMGQPGVLPGEKAIFFTNANASQIQIPYAAAMDGAKFTAEVWLKIPIFPIGYTLTGDIVPLSFVYNGDGVAGWVFDLLSDTTPSIDQATGFLYGWAAQGAGETFTFIGPKTGSGFDFQGKWEYAALTYNGSTLSLYEDAKLVEEASATYKQVGLFDHSLEGKYPLVMGS
jgi:hypothetical protein